MNRFVKRPSEDAAADASAPKKASTEPAAASTTTAPHLSVTDEERAFLLEHGYLIKLNVVPTKDCERAQLAFEQALCALNPTASTQSPADWAKGEMPANVHGIQEMGRLAHVSCVKDIRLHPNIAAVWRSLLRTDLVCASWDRINYMPKGTQDTKKAWHHTDVEPEFFRKATDLDGYVPVQSYVQVSDSGRQTVSTEPAPANSTDAAHSACLVVWEHSNLAHADYFRRKGSDFRCKTKNWHIYEPETVAEWERDGRSFLPATHPAKNAPQPFPMRRLELRIPRGAMVFWLSQTAHQNTVGSAKLARFVVYTCYCPKRLVTKRDRENFWKAMQQLRCTTHWPGMGQVHLFPKTPHLFSKERVDAYHAMEARLDVKELAFDAREKQLLP